MRNKRYKLSSSNWGIDTFCICSVCGSEVCCEYRKILKNKLCPKCGNSLITKDYHYLRLKIPTERASCLCYDEKSLAVAEFKKSDFISYDNMVSSGYHTLGNPVFDQDEPIENAFCYMRLLQQDVYRKYAENRIKVLESKISTDSKTLKSLESSVVDTQQIKQYLEYVIQVEINIEAVKTRLEELYSRFQKNAEDVKRNEKLVILQYEKLVREAKDETFNYSENVELKKIEKQKRVSIKPTKPDEPMYQKPGLFNKRKVESANAELRSQYETKLEEYEFKLKKWEEEERAYKEEEKKQRALINAENKKMLEDALEKAQQKYEKANEELTFIKASIKDRPNAALGEQALINNEIKVAEKTYKELLKCRIVLYDANIIFPKYRNLVAVSSFYEYLMSGRCSALEGSSGAYNIYESEIRANQVIAQLSEVLKKLDEIKQNQYMVYSVLEKMNDNLESLNRSMDTAVGALKKIDEKQVTMAEYLNNINLNTKVIAYNTARTAYYSEKTAELTNALGFMVALK